MAHNEGSALLTTLHSLIPNVKIILKRAEIAQNSELICLSQRLVTKLQSSASNSNAAQEVKELLKKIYDLEEKDSRTSQEIVDIAWFLKNQLSIFSMLSASGNMESSPQAQIVNASNSHAKLISNQRVGLVSNEWIANQRYERSNDDPEKGRKRLFGLLHKPSTAEVAKKAKYKPLPDTSNRLTLEDYKSLDATSRDKIQLINDSKRTKKSDDEETSEGSMEFDTLPFAVFPKSDNVVNKKRMKSDGSDSSLDIDALPLADVSSEPENFDIDTSTSSLDMTTESLPIEKNATSKIIEFSCETSRKYTIARKIGYTIVKNNGRDQIAYKCFCPGCPFVLNKAESFRTHLITDHSSLHWNRFCTACGDFVDLNRPNPILGILDEFNHIQTVHINAESLMKDKVPFKNIEPSEPTPLKTPQNSDESANKQSKMLRPWLNHPIWKHNIAAAMMMSENCLAAQYKCMEVKCVFFTSKEQHFEDHLRYHIKSRIAQGHFCCAYCCFEAPDSESLVAHLRKKHEFDIYCCKYCFYRSAAQVNVQTHLNVFHSDEEPVIIECIPRLRADNEAAKKFMESTSNIKKVIPRLHCFLCRDAFYLISGFKTHLESHKSYDPVKKFTCKCKLEIEFGSFLQHTEKCFKISSHQCGYCRFSSNTLEPLKLHYANKHATKLPYYLMRTEHENANPKSTQALTTCFIGQKISDYTIKRKCVESKQVINSEKTYILDYNS